jgi:hypothetical protein
METNRLSFFIDTDRNVYVEANVPVAIDVAVGENVSVYNCQHNI